MTNIEFLNIEFRLKLAEGSLQSCKIAQEFKSIICYMHGWHPSNVGRWTVDVLCCRGAVLCFKCVRLMPLIMLTLHLWLRCVDPYCAYAMLEKRRPTGVVCKDDELIN